MSDEDSDEGEIQDTVRPPSRVTSPSPAVCNRPKRGTQQPARYTDFAQQVLNPAFIFY